MPVTKWQTPLEEPAILYEDRQVVVVHKPSGWLSQPDETGDPCISDWLVNLLRARKDLLLRPKSPSDNPSSGPEPTSYNPFVAPVHRLDRPVSGVLALVRTSKAAARLAGQFASRDTEKVYLAIGERFAGIGSEARTVTLYLTKDRTNNRVRWSSDPEPGSEVAVTDVRELRTAQECCLLELRPHTGRPHQLRVTMAFLGSPVAGDLKYGAGEGFGTMIALHAFRLVFRHPTHQALVDVQSPIPAWWNSRFPALFR